MSFGAVEITVLFFFSCLASLLATSTSPKVTLLSVFFLTTRQLRGKAITATPLLQCTFFTHSLNWHHLKTHGLSVAFLKGEGEKKYTQKKSTMPCSFRVQTSFYRWTVKLKKAVSFSRIWGCLPYNNWYFTVFDYGHALFEFISGGK